MIQQAVATQKKAEYRLKDLIDGIPNGRLIEEKNALAAQLGIGVPQLNRLIRGDSDLSGTQLRIIADFFGCGVNELYADNELAAVSAEMVGD
jgi:transcriptional regulator with XRE-family HTH domain